MWISALQMARIVKVLNSFMDFMSLDTELVSSLQKNNFVINPLYVPLQGKSH